MNGQCFNFAYAMCQLLKNSQILSELYLVAAVGTRINHGDVEQVCIHCIAKVYSAANKEFICLDARGSHADGYLEEVVDIWQSVEFELTGALEEVDITEYAFFDEHELQSYWIDLEKAGAQENLSVIQYAKQYICNNISLFQDALLKI